MDNRISHRYTRGASVASSFARVLMVAVLVTACFLLNVRAESAPEIVDRSRKHTSTSEDGREGVLWGESANGLQCRLLPATQPVSVREGQNPTELEVYVTYQLRNVGTKGLKFQHDLTPLRDADRFEVIGPDGQKVHFVGVKVSRPPAPLLVLDLGPGKTSSCDVRLEYDFTKPGTYKVSITTSKKAAPDGPDIMGYYEGVVERAKRNTDNVWTGTLTSNTVTVEAVRAVSGKPAGPAKEAAPPPAAPAGESAVTRPVPQPATVPAQSDARTAEQYASTLVEALRREPVRRKDLVEELARIGPPAVPVLVRALKDEHEAVRGHAAMALERIGPAAKEAVPVLISLLKDGSEFVRGQAAAALGSIGAMDTNVVTALVPLLRDTRNVRLLSAHALGRIGATDKSAIRALADALKDNDGGVRCTAASGLRQAGPAAQDAIPALMQALKDQDGTVRFLVIETLAKIGAAAVPPLTEAMKHGDQELRARAAWTLGQIGPAAQGAIPALVETLKTDDDKEVRTCAAWGLHGIGAAALPALIQVLREGRGDVRRAAAEAIGSDARNAVPALIDAAKDNDAAARREAVAALGRIGSVTEQVVPVVRKALKDKDRGVRQAAARAFGDMKSAAGPAIPDLIEAVRDKDVWVRRYAIETLGSIGPAAKEAVPALTEALSDAEPVIREKAAAALKRIAESKEPPTPPADPQTAKVFITADPVAAVKKALPDGWVLDSHGRSGGSGYKIELRRQTFEKAFRAVLVILPPNAKQRPEEHGPGKTFTTILRAENGEASLWADAGNWTTIEQDLAKALVGQPMRVEPFVAEFIDQQGVRQRVRIRANWLLLLHFRFSPASFEKACRLALLESPVADAQEVRTYTGGDREPLIVEMGELVILPADASAGQAAAPATGVVERQIELLKSDDVPVRIEAARALARFGPAAEKAIPTLIEAIRDELRRDPTNMQFRSQRGGAGFWAADALGEIGPTAVPHLAALLTDKERRLRVYAAWALRKIGPPARKAVPGLCQALTDDLYSFEARFIAAAVVAIGPTEEAIPGLIRGLRGEHPVLAWAALGLAKMGPAAVPHLIQTLNDRDTRQEYHDARWGALKALELIGPPAKAAVPTLVGIVRDRHAGQRAAAAAALGAIGTDAKEAIPALRDLLEDEEPGVARAAAAALKQIRPMEESPQPAPREPEAKTVPKPAMQPIKAHITADPIGAIKKAMPEGWGYVRQEWLDPSGCTIKLKDGNRPGEYHAVLTLLPPGTPRDTNKTVILNAANGEVFLWADPGKWTTIEQDLAKALTGEPLRVAEFVAEFRAPRDAYKDIVRDAGGAIMEARIRPNWLQLLRFGLTQEKLEQACRKALAERAVADIRDVWVDTGSHRDMHLVDMGEVFTAVGRQWPEADTPLDQAVGRAASILRASDGSRAEVFERGRMHMSTVGEHGRGGGFLTHAWCRQAFKVVEVLRGQPVAGPLTVQYRFVEESRCFPGPRAEQPIPPNTAVILVLGDKGGLLKVLPDTEEDRKAVKAAEAARRAEVLRKGPLDLVLEYHGRGWRSYVNLWMYNGPPLPSAQLPPPWISLRPDQKEADAAVRFLVASGFLDRAEDVYGQCRFPPLGLQVKPPGPCYTLLVRCGEEVLYGNLGWGLDTLTRLERFRAALTGADADAIDELLERLEPYRQQWQRAAGAPPAPTIDWNKPRTYKAAPWEYQLSILGDGQRKAPGQWGCLYYRGKPLAAPRTNDSLETPWGVLFDIDVPSTPNGLHGWLPGPSQRVKEPGKRLPSPLDALRFQRLDQHRNTAFIVFHEGLGSAAGRPYTRLLLTGEKSKEDAVASRLVARLSAQQMHSLLLHLAYSGWLGKAVADQAFVHPGTPAYVMYVADGERTYYYQNLGWGPPMLERLTELRNFLEGDAGTQMDKLLGGLNDLKKQWQAALTSQPTSLEEVKVVLEKLTGGDWAIVKYEEPVGPVLCGYLRPWSDFNDIAYAVLPCEPADAGRAKVQRFTDKAKGKTRLFVLGANARFTILASEERSDEAVSRLLTAALKLEESKAAEGDSPLEISVALQQPIMAEMRVPITVKIKNVSANPINLPWPKFINQFVSTVSTAQDQAVLTVRHTGLALGHGKYPGGDLKPAEEMTVEVWHIFPAAGRHTFQCVLETSRKNTPWWSFWEGRAQSRPISVGAEPRKDR